MKNYPGLQTLHGPRPCLIASAREIARPFPLRVGQDCR
nr:MAG TPA: hypothetical protein [Caudoviricetes sp.]DAU49073.1 MAG TPA: hypothetical protein [Caudoviricetes sp.]